MDSTSKIRLVGTEQAARRISRSIAVKTFIRIAERLGLKPAVFKGPKFMWKAEQIDAVRKAYKPIKK